MLNEGTVAHPDKGYERLPITVRVREQQGHNPAKPDEYLREIATK